MRKEMNSKSKRKWVAGGLAAFASVALLTTGFATWIVGTSKTSSEHDGLKVNVDTAKNASIELIATLSDDSVTFAEDAPVAGGKFVQSDATNGDLNITFSELKIVYGVASGFNPTLDTCELQFTLLQINGADAATKNTVVYSSSTDIFGRDGSKTYIEAPKAVKLKEASVGSASDSESSGSKTYTFSQKTFAFRWGSAFDYKSPCTYYNEKFDAGSGAPKKNTANAAIVYNELTDMKTKLNPDGEGTPGSLKLKVEVVGYTAAE